MELDNLVPVCKITWAGMKGMAGRLSSFTKYGVIIVGSINLFLIL